MRKSLKILSLLLLLTLSHSLMAQEARTDSLPPLGSGMGSSIRNYDGYLLDMSQMNILPEVDMASDTRHTLPLMPLKSVLERLNLKTGVTYSTLSTMGSYPLYPHIAAPYAFPSSFQTATYRLGNGGSMTLMGDYGYDGRKRVSTPSVFHNVSRSFHGGFQYKSPSSGFSFSVQVHAGRGGYPY